MEHNKNKNGFGKKFIGENNNLRKIDKTSEEFLAKLMPSLNIDKLIEEVAFNLTDKKEEFKDLGIVKNQIGDSFTTKELKDYQHQKSSDYIKSVMNTEISKLNYELISSVGLSLVLLQELQFNYENINENLGQLIFKKNISFTAYIYLLTMNKTNVLFTYYCKLYNKLINNEIKSFKIKSHLEDLNKHEIDMPNGVYFSDNNNVLLVVYEKQCVWFKFKTINLHVAEIPLPGFDILLSYYNKLKTIGDEQKIEQNKTNQVEVVCDFSEGVDEYELNLNQICEYLKVTKEEYIQKLLINNPNISLNKDGKAVMINNLNQVSGDDVDEYVQLPEDFSCSKLNMVSNNRDYLFATDLTRKEIFFVGDRVDIYLSQAYSVGRLPYCFLKFFCLITCQTKNVFIFKESDLNLETYDVEIRLEEEPEAITYEKPDLYLRFTGESNKFEHLYKGKSSELVLKENKDKVLFILNKMKTSKATKSEIRYVSMFYGYISRKAYNVSNFRIRDVLDLLNEHKQYKPFLDVLITRYGDNATLLCNMFIFYTTVKLTKNGVNILNKIKWWKIKSENWVSFYSQLSKWVKTKEHLFGYKITYIEFKNLQYMEQFIGQLGPEGKSAKDVVKERMYAVINKKVINWVGDKRLVNGKELADKVCRAVCREYWKQVFDKPIKFVGLVDILHNRLRFATSSSTAGSKSLFESKQQIEKLLTLDKDFNNKFAFETSNKLSAFYSEDDLFFERVIFDLPLTISNMVLKPKEMAKIRYIFSVWMPHYLMNSCLTLNLEPNLNRMGVTYFTSDLEQISHNWKDTADLYNDVDYSVFNDQHQMEHRNIFLEELKFISQQHLKKEDYNDFELVIDWMITANCSMLIRVNSDPNVIFEHKGRLFSGERSTTLVNSIMSIYYYYLIQVNMWIFKCSYSDKFKQFFLDQIISDIHEGKLTQEIFEVSKKNRALGDDNEAEIQSIFSAHLFNEMAVLSGFLLKTEKCLVGIMGSEFLRLLKIKTIHKKTIKKGYVNRAITTFVAGNLEGTEDREWTAQIIQIYQQCRVIYQRSQNVGLLNEIINLRASQLCHINRTGLELKFKFFKEWLYTRKNQGGLGLVKLGDNKYYIPNQRFLPFPKKRLELVKGYKKLPEAIKNYLQKDIVPDILKVGPVNGKGVERYVLKALNDLVQSNNSTKNYYSKEELLEIKDKWEENFKRNEKGGVWVSSTDFLSKRSIHVADRLFDYFGMKIHNKQVITGLNKKLERLERIYPLIDTKHSLFDIIRIKFGTFEAGIWSSRHAFEAANTVSEWLDQGVFNLTMGVIFDMIPDSLSYPDEAALGLRVYLEHAFYKHI